jgi:hypothetical protein
MKRFAVVLTTAIVLAAPAAPAAATDDLSPFVRLFPHLPGFTEPTDQQLADLAQLQLDNGGATTDNVGVPAGFTYFGQFIDHDLTLDVTPQPDGPVDPTTLDNHRTPRFDLDSVYGKGPNGSPELYEADKKHLRVSEPTATTARDLPRNADGSAILGDGRNDENQIIAQLHVGALKFHNKLVDQGHSFANAQRLTQWHYQWVVVKDYLPHVAGQARVDQIQRPLEIARRLGVKPPHGLLPPTPIEFSVAAFRYGHSQVRNAYRLNADFAASVFSLTPGAVDLRGGRPIELVRQIEWARFFDVDGTVLPQNISKKLDTLISNSLFQLPIPGAAGSGSNVLGFRNLVRADRYGLPSGERVADTLHIPRLTAAELATQPGPLPAGFENGTPLWYYALAESSARENGERLGPVMGNLVVGTFMTYLYLDRSSYLFKTGGAFTPSVPHEGDFTIGDFLKFAGVAS